MKKFFTLIVVAVLAFAAQANELAVCQGEYYSGYTPIYGLWYDVEGMSQSIYPADMLADMNGAEITALKFYTAAKYFEGTEDEMNYVDNPYYFIHVNGGEITLSLMEVDAEGYTEAVAMTGAQVVATTVPEEGSMELAFVLNEPFEYNGGNLLVQVAVTTPGGYGTTYFWGESFDYAVGYYEYTGYSGTLYQNMMSFLPAITFTYETGDVPPVEPTERTAAPVFNGYTTDGIHAYFVEIIETEPSTIYYKVYIWDAATEDWTIVGDDEWLEYEEILSFTGDGKYRVEAYAVAPGKLPSYDIAYEFIVSPITGLSELASGKTVASQRYFNMAGQEMSEANGLTIVVTTYTDGTTSTAKVVK